MEPNSDDNDLKGFPEDPYEADNLETVEMDMENSDEDLEHPANGDCNNDHNNQPIDNQVDTNDNNDLNNIEFPVDDICDDNVIPSQAKSYVTTDEKISQSHRTPRFRPTIIQVLNIPPSATLEHMRNLFSYIGDIVNIELYSCDQNSDQNFKVCFVEFKKSTSVLVAKHLTNTVLIDRVLTVLAYHKLDIPSKEVALESMTGSEYLTNFDCGVHSHITTGAGGTQSISTTNPRLIALGLSQYPLLPVNTDPTRVEEIRRTVYIGNLDTSIPPDEVLKFFNDIGEVKYIRMAGDDSQPTRFAFVEFTHQSSIANALQHNGHLLGTRTLKINHSNNTIAKPQPKIEIDDSSRKLRRARSSSRDRHYSSRYDRDRDRRRDQELDRDRDRYYDSYRRESPRSRRSRSRSRDFSSRRRSKSRDRSLRRSKSRDRATRRRSRSRDARRRRSRSPNERSTTTATTTSSSSSSRHRKKSKR